MQVITGARRAARTGYRAVLLAGIAALIPVSAAGVPAEAVQNIPDAAFNPPANDLVLTRTVYRDLGDGEQIRVERSYAVRFLPDAGGYRLDGRLIDVAVDAPADLAPFAQLERTRPDTTLLPIRLDASGAILDNGVAAPSAAPGQAAALARSAIAGAQLSPEARQAAIQQIARITTDPSVYGRVPADLFRPSPGERHERRVIALPGGMQGTVEMRTVVEGVGPDGLPGRVEQVITTELDGTKRVSKEVWSLIAK
ncbi:MAG: hypothetical protein JSR96_11160 [Proteobacteria bacterium]|nr:hypothetical protein [Pseudomonadota bacterium]